MSVVLLDEFTDKLSRCGTGTRASDSPLSKHVFILLHSDTCPLILVTMIGLNEISSLQLLPFFFAAWVVCFVSTAIYRLFFSPVAGFPGPKLAALSDWRVE